MNFINTPPLAQRKQIYVKLTYNYGYDENGNYGKNNIGEVIVINNGDIIESESQTGYIKQSKEYAIDKANELGLNFIYVNYN